MTIDVPRHITPLPLRVAPAPDEAFYSYLHRVAAMYKAAAATILAPLMPHEPAPTRVQRLRRQCLAVSPPTADLLQSYFHLEPAELAGMFAALSPQASRPPTDQQLQDWDPFLPWPEKAPRIPMEFAGPRLRRACRDCQRDAPVLWCTSWQFTYQLLCPIHDCYLGGYQYTGRPCADRSVIVTQASVTEIAQRRAPAPQGMPRSLYVQTISEVLVLSGQRRPAALGVCLGLAHRVLRASPTALFELSHRFEQQPPPETWWDTPTIDPDAVARWPVVRAHHHTGTRSQGDLDKDRAWVSVVPLELYNGTLSDLAYPLDPYLGRVIAAIHCEGFNPMARVLQPVEVAPACLELVVRLELQGRLDLWWNAIATCRTALNSSAQNVEIQRRRSNPPEPPWHLTDRKDYDLLEAWVHDWLGYVHFPRPDTDRFDAFVTKHDSELQAYYQGATPPNWSPPRRSA